jgi:hypothetical protein
MITNHFRRIALAQGLLPQATQPEEPAPDRSNPQHKREDETQDERLLERSAS